MFIGLVSVVVILCNLFLKKSKLFYILTFLWLWILMAGTYGIADENIYISRYNSPEIWSSTTEFLYYWIIIFCNKLGMEFIEFKLAITFLQLLLIFSTVWKYGLYPNLVVALYFFFPFPFHVAQMRNALATSIFIWGLRYIIQDDGVIVIKKLKLTKNDIKFIFAVLIASCIHTASIGWLVLLIAKKMDLKFNVLFAIISNLLIMFVLSPENISQLLSIFGGGVRIGTYLSEVYQFSSYRHYGSVMGILFTFVFISILCGYIICSKKDAINLEQIKLLLKCNISVLYILSVVIRYTGEIYRIQEGIAVLNLMLISNSIYYPHFHIRKMSKGNLTVVCTLVLYTVCIFWLRLLRYQIQSIILPILQNNVFISF